MYKKQVLSSLTHSFNSLMYYYPSLIITITFRVVFKHSFFSCSSVWYTLMPDTAFLISILHNPPISKHLELFSVYRMQTKSYLSFHWRNASSLFSTCFLTWSLHSVIWTYNTHFWIVFVYAASVCYLNSLCLSFPAYYNFTDSTPNVNMLIEKGLFGLATWENFT